MKRFIDKVQDGFIVLASAVFVALCLTAIIATARTEARQSVAWSHWVIAAEGYSWNGSTWVLVDALPGTLNLLSSQGFEIVSISVERTDAARLVHIVGKTSSAPVGTSCPDYDPNTPGMQGPYPGAVCWPDGGWR
jgi:hypothetical protein